MSWLNQKKKKNTKWYKYLITCFEGIGININNVNLANKQSINDFTKNIKKKKNKTIILAAFENFMSKRDQDQSSIES